MTSLDLDYIVMRTLYLALVFEWNRAAVVRFRPVMRPNFSDLEPASGKSVSYLPPLLHLIKFKVNKMHVALKVHLTVSAIQVI